MNHLSTEETVRLHPWTEGGEVDAPGLESWVQGRLAWQRQQIERLLAVDEALDRLAEEDQAVAEVVKLRYFVGLTIEETADVLRISVRTVNRHWAYARAWLYKELKNSVNPDSRPAFPGDA